MTTILHFILAKVEEKAGWPENVLESQVMRKKSLNLRYLQTTEILWILPDTEYSSTKAKKKKFQSSCACRKSCMWWHSPYEVWPSHDKQATTTRTSLFKAVLCPQQESDICFHSGGTFTLPIEKPGWQRNNEMHTGSLKEGSLTSARHVPGCRTGISPSLMPWEADLEQTLDRFKE